MSSRDWNESGDIAFFTGYQGSVCKACHKTFIGHKRRTLCKECDKGDSQSPLATGKPWLKGDSQ